MTFERLRALRAEVASLCAVKCRMAHERVLCDAITGRPAACRVPAGSYRRVGLCAPERRATQLGCSHTSARIKLEDAIAILAAHTGEKAQDTSLWRQEATWLNNAIHLLDHRKGDAEKQLAELLESAHRSGSAVDAESVRAVRDRIRALEDRHDALVERIARLQAQVLAEIERQLREPAPN